MQVTRVLRNGFVLTYSSGAKYPECASSIHTAFPQDLAGASQQIFFTFKQAAGHEAPASRSNRDVQLRDNNPFEEGLRSTFVVSFLSAASII